MVQVKNYEVLAWQNPIRSKSKDKQEEETPATLAGLHGR